MESPEAVRALVTVDTVTAISEIEIACAKVRGWNLVVPPSTVRLGSSKTSLTKPMQRWTWPTTASLASPA